MNTVKSMDFVGKSPENKKEETKKMNKTYEIRRCATENNVTIFTSLDTVRVLLDVLDENTITISTIDS